MPTLLPTDQWLPRAQSVLKPEMGPTLYWLGAGGLEPTAPHPGEACHLVLDQNGKWKSQTLASIQAKAKPLSSLYDTSKSIDDRYQRPACIQLRSCDCSGFICWVMGIAAVQAGQRVSTSVMMADAEKEAGAQWFQYLEKPTVGCLWIYRRGTGVEVGHVAIVSQLNAAGEVTEFIDCSGESFRATGNAIAARYSNAFELHASKFLTRR